MPGAGDHETGGLALALSIAEELALRAGEIVRRHRARGVVRQRKPDGELVTLADLEADALIRAGLAARFPGDAILSEELADDGARLRATRVWVVDPIDGTSDYARGGDEHAISIGLTVGGEAVLGVVFNAARGELFSGARGHGVTLDGAPVGVTAADDVSRAQLTTSRTEWEAGTPGREGALGARPVSSAAYKLARVAAGLDDGTFSRRPRREWDVCAGTALVLAAGGEVTGLDGSPVVFNRAEVRMPAGIAAAGPRLLPSLLAALQLLGVATAPPP